MEIAIISDTHIESPSDNLVREYENVLSGADVLIHCGDITGFSTWQYLRQHPNLYAVRGNCDWDPELVNELQTMLRVTLDDISVGVAHGWGSRSGVPARVSEAFGPEFDLVCYGHTHKPDWSVVGGVQLVNPGSFAEGSYAVVELNNGVMSCRFMNC